MYKEQKYTSHQDPNTGVSVPGVVLACVGVIHRGGGDTNQGRHYILTDAGGICYFM